MAFALSAALASNAVPLATFDGAASTTFDFTELNDPVMGGKSTGTWKVDGSGFGVFDGEVVDVPSLSAPGFIKAAADGKFADVGSLQNGEIVLTVRTATPEYKGFRFSFYSGSGAGSYACAGGGGIPFSRGCYKAKFSVPAGNDFTSVRIPFSEFSDQWSSATGEHTKECADDPDVCPTAKKLAQISRLEVWAEGVLGKAHLEVKSISAEGLTDQGRVFFGLAASPPRPPAQFDTCQGSVQPMLRYGISGRTTPTVPVAVDASETLATAICCDDRTKVFAEPQFLFQAPDIDLFSKLSGPTTFYDSVCGLPLFTAPKGRTMQEFNDDTTEHGWPSFRPAELIAENVLTNKTSGFVYSKCGTHLGSYLPDDKGARWCLDLSCVAGNPAA